MTANPLRDLPSVHEILETSAVRALTAAYAHVQVVTAIRQELAELRDRLLHGEPSDGLTALDALAQGRAVIGSRGQLLELGGSCRIPEIMAVSGAVLREVRTTNITRLEDYERAIGPNSAALLRVHPSNYLVTGFTKSVSLDD